MVAALLIAAFTVMPVADAAMCAADGQTSHSAVDGDGASLSVFADEDGHEGSSSPELLQDHCEHGHCHHAASHVATDSPVHHLVSRHGHERPGHEGAISFTPDGLMRPPKA